MKVIKKLSTLLIALLAVGHVYANDGCRLERSIATTFGALDMEVCKTQVKVTPPPSSTNPANNIGFDYVYTLRIDGKPLLRAAYLSRVDRDKTRSFWIFRGDSLQETGCPDRHYLIDLSLTPVKVIAFGVKKACNEFQLASWGEKRSVIALKNNVKFTYENGKMIVPAAGEKLWKAIEPPHAGAGLNEEDAIPFAEDVPLPK